MPNTVMRSWKFLYIEKFKKVKVSGLSIEWENGADICPDELYNNSNKIA